VLVVAGAVLLLGGTRMPLYEVRRLDLEWNAWSNAWSLYPVALLGALYGCVPAAALVRSRVRRRPWTRTQAGASTLLAVACLVTVLAYWLRDVRLGTIVLDTGRGGWVMFLGATASASGSWLHYNAAVAESVGTAPRPRRRNYVGPEIMLAWLGTLVVLVSSFLTVFDLPGVGGHHVHASAWSRNFSPPLFLLPLLWALALAALVTARVLPGRARPRTIIGVARADVEVALAALSVVTMLGLTFGHLGFRAFGRTSDIGRELGLWGMGVGTVLDALSVGLLARSAKSL
jgi:hypothetical protein